MINVSSAFQWFGDRVTDLVLGEVNDRLERAGQQFVARASATVHVDTGEMRAGLFYRVEGRTLVLGDTSSHSLFEAAGTRYRAGHPQLFEAINSIGSIFGTNLELDFAVPSIASPVLAHGGHMIVPSGIQPKPLTQAQHRRVQANQAEYRRHYRGNVKRAKMRVRRFD